MMVQKFNQYEQFLPFLPLIYTSLCRLINPGIYILIQLSMYNFSFTFHYVVSHNSQQNACKITKQPTQQAQSMLLHQIKGKREYIGLERYKVLFLLKDFAESLPSCHMHHETFNVMGSSCDSIIAL